MIFEPSAPSEPDPGAWKSNQREYQILMKPGLDPRAPGEISSGWQGIGALGKLGMWGDSKGGWTESLGLLQGFPLKIPSGYHNILLERICSEEKPRVFLGFSISPLGIL